MHVSSTTVNNSSIGFQGKLVIVNDFTAKPKQCLSKVQGKLQKLVEKKDFNLYLQQDYSKNEMRIIADYPFPLKSEQKTPLLSRAQINIPITSKSSKYVEAAKDVLDVFKRNLNLNEQQAWKQKQKNQRKENFIEKARTVLFAPVLIAEAVLNEINPKWANKFDKLIDKVLYKKGI